MTLPCRNCGTANADGRPHECVSTVPTRRKVRRTVVTEEEVKRVLTDIDYALSAVRCEINNDGRINAKSINLDKLQEHCEHLFSLEGCEVVG